MSDETQNDPARFQFIFRDGRRGQIKYMLRALAATLNSGLRHGEWVEIAGDPGDEEEDNE